MKYCIVSLAAEDLAGAVKYYEDQSVGYKVPDNLDLTYLIGRDVGYIGFDEYESFTIEFDKTSIIA